MFENDQNTHNPRQSSCYSKAPQIQTGRHVDDSWKRSAHIRPQRRARTTRRQERTIFEIRRCWFAGASIRLVPTDAEWLQIGINLSDPIFRGVYHGKKAHDDDLPQIVQRALGAGCRKLMVTGSDLEESQKAIELAEQYRASIPRRW